MGNDIDRDDMHTYPDVRHVLHRVGDGIGRLPDEVAHLVAGRLELVADLVDVDV